eukprot:11426098-Alexandrium_andersonii.AAC.1
MLALACLGGASARRGEGRGLGGPRVVATGTVGGGSSRLRLAARQRPLQPTQLSAEAAAEAVAARARAAFAAPPFAAAV